MKRDRPILLGRRAASGAAIALLALSLPAVGLAQSEHVAHHEASNIGASKPVAMTNGVIRKVDKATGSVTIAHEPLVNLGMPKMTMSFLVKDRSWLDTMKEGSSIRFVAQDVNGELTVVAYEQAK
jgi:Cu/Ag efflux protein CusF